HSGITLSIRQDADLDRERHEDREAGEGREDQQGARTHTQTVLPTPENAVPQVTLLTAPPYNLRTPTTLAPGTLRDGERHIEHSGWCRRPRTARCRKAPTRWAQG